MQNLVKLTAGQPWSSIPAGELAAAAGMSPPAASAHLIYAETPQLFHARNPFPIGGVYEDPATGAAAAAFAGYLRDLEWPHGGSIEIIQGEDMGMRSRLIAEISPASGVSIRVSGTARLVTLEAVAA